MNRLSDSEPTWWQAGTVYQIYPRSFKDTSGNGVGDLAGITQKLTYLEWLGIDAVWLSPIYPSPMRDFGYDVSDYAGVDPLFGTLDDFNELIAEAHRRGIKIVLDFVPNHCSAEHPWFRESRASRDNPKRDWFTWRDAKPDGSAPNNWRSATALDTPGSAWAWDETTAQYYLASFSSYQPDLDWRNDAVREALMDALRFWLERGVDGFRIDMLDFLGKDAELRDEPPETEEAEDYLSAAKYHLNRPEMHDYIREMHRTVHAYPERVLVGETLYFIEPEQINAYYGDGQGLDLPFHFGLMFLPMEAGRLRAKVDAYDAAIGQNQPNYNLANHDRPRLSRHADRARLAAMLLLTLRGTPFMYYGDELNMPNVEVPPDRQQDPFIIHEIGTTRDAMRTPMQWSAEANAGFTDDEAEPWLPISTDYARINVESEQQDERSMLWLYKRLLELRRATPALNIGDYRSVDGVPDGVFAYVRGFEGTETLVVLNFSDAACEVALPEGRWHLALSTALDRQENVVERVVLRAFEGIILQP